MAELQAENAKLRHLLQRSRIHLSSASRQAAKRGQHLVAAELAELAKEIREAVGAL